MALLSRQHRRRKRAFQLESESGAPLDMDTAAIRTDIIPIIGGIIGPLSTWDLATIGTAATVSIITTGDTGKTISRNFYELAGDPKPAHSFQDLAHGRASPCA